MGVINTTTYVCEQCQAKTSVDNGPMGGGGIPGGWLQVMQAYSGGVNLWFDKWECIRDYATERGAATV